MILVTGSQGFIGRYVFFALKELGYKCEGFDYKDAGVLLGRLSLKELDKYDTIIHLAAFLDGLYSENYASTSKLADTGKRIIFTSSAAVYGDNANAHEDDLLNPIGEYGAVKLAEEKLLKPTDCILRLGNVYGAGSDHGIVSKLMYGRPVIYNSGKSVRDFVHVTDVMRAIIQALKDEWQGTYNIATGKGTQIRDLIPKFSNGVSLGTIKTDEIKTSILNINKAKAKGYSPRYEI